MRRMNECFLIDSIINRRDISAVICCMRSGAYVNEFLLHNVVNDINMLCAIINHSKHVIEIRSGMIFTVLRQDYQGKRDVIKYLLERCRVSQGAGVSSILLDAVRHGDMDMVGFITNRWNVVLTTPLVVAAQECQYDILRFLYKKGTFATNTLDIALCNTIFTNVELLKKKEQLTKVVSFLFKNGATRTAPLLKMCAFKSLIHNDFTILTIMLSFYELKDIMNNLDSYTTDAPSIETWENCVANAFRLQRAAIKIVHGFRVRRRLNLVRCIFHNKAVYSPTLAYIIAKEGGL